MAEGHDKCSGDGALDNMMNTLGEVKSVKKKIDDLKVWMEGLQKRLDYISCVVQQFEIEHANLLERVNGVSMYSFDKELQGRKKNIIVYNVRDSVRQTKQELESEVMRIFNHMVGSNVRISEIDHMKRLPGSKYCLNRPVLVKFLSSRRKQEILRLSRQLTGTEVAISMDMTLEERKARKAIWKQIKKCRERGLRARRVGIKAVVEGRLFSLQDFQKGVVDDVLGKNCLTKGNRNPTGNEPRKITNISGDFNFSL